MGAGGKGRTRFFPWHPLPEHTSADECTHEGEVQRCLSDNVYLVS